MTRDEAQDTIYQCLKLLDSVDALLHQARQALGEDEDEYEVEFTPWTEGEVVQLDDYRDPE